MEEHLDWTGVGTWTDSPGQPVVFGAPEFQRYTTRFGWNPNGQLAFWGAPLRDATEIPREYASEYARGALIGLLEADFDSSYRVESAVSGDVLWTDYADKERIPVTCTAPGTLDTSLR